MAKQAKKAKKPLEMKDDQLEYALALNGMLVNDIGKNGLTQKEIAFRMGVGPSTLSRMRNLRRLIHAADIQLYCNTDILKEDTRDYIRIAAAIKKYPKRKEAMRAARAFMKAKGRKERVLLRKVLDSILFPFLLYYTKKEPAKS